MYFLARRWTGNGLAASVAGVAFAFNGLTLNCLMWPNNIAALGWTPWVVLCVERACLRGSNRLITAASVGSIQVLTGAPEIILLTWVVLGAIGASRIFTNRTRFRPIVSFLGAGLLTLTLSAVQLLPFLDLLAHSHRDNTFGDSAWSMPATGLANFLVPLFHTFQGMHGVYWQHDQYWTSSYYLGVGIVGLAVIAASFERRREVRLLVLIVAAGIILALGDSGFVFGWLRKTFPPLGFMRFPIKFIVMVAFALPLLAAFGLRHWLESGNSVRQRLRLASLLTVLMLLVLILIIVRYASIHPGKQEDWVSIWQNGFGRAIFLTLAGLTIFLITWLKPERKRWLASLALLLWVVLDVLNHAPRQNPIVARRAFEPGLLQLSPQPRHGEARAMTSPAANMRLRQFATSDPLKNYICARLALFVNCNLLDAIPNLEGFYSLYLRETDAIRSALYFSTNSPPDSLCDFLNVAYVTAPEDFMRWTFRPTYMPLATAGQRPVFADDPTVFNTIMGTNFEPRHTVYLPLAAASFVTITNRTEASITLSQFAAHRTKIEIMASEPSVIVLAQNHHHAWRAFIDGHPANLWRANYSFQAVVAPAGKHTLELLYRDWQFYWGLAISIVCLTGCLIAQGREGEILHCRPPGVASVSSADKRGPSCCQPGPREKTEQLLRTNHAAWLVSTQLNRCRSRCWRADVAGNVGFAHNHFDRRTLQII
jgi:hypothetical protein